MPVSTPLSYLGIGKGASVAPTNFLPVKTITPEDVVTYLPVEPLKGSFPKVYGMVQGVKHTTFEIAGPVFADMIGWPLMGLLGDVTTTASRTVTDGVTTSGSPNVTSATAAFVAGDVGKAISATGIPAGSVILTVTSATAVVISQNATATGSALSLTIGPPNWHVGAVLNSGTGQPTAHTLTDFYGLTSGTPARQYGGIQWHEVDIKFSQEGLLEHTSKATGLIPSLQVAKPASSWSTVQPTPGWTGLVTIGGTAQGLTADGNVTITRTMELVPAMTGTQQYLAVWLGDIMAKFKFAMIVNDDTELLRMLNNTQPSLDLNFSQGTGASAQQLVLHMSQGAYEKAKPNRGKQYVVYDIEGQAVGNVTDVGASGGFGVISARVGNSLAAGTYV